MISAIVLAAGMSTRMGAENKLLLPFRGTTLIGNMVDVVTGSRVGETLVILGHEAERVRAALAGKPVTFVDNPNYAEGMGSSVQAGVRAVSPQATGIMVCLTDLPLIESAELDRLIAAFEAGQAGKSIAVPCHQGQRGNPVLFSARFRDEVLGTRGPVAGCRGIVKKYPDQVIEVEMAHDHILRDIDTIEDYRRLVGTPA
jgi:molybdenum cofactor cytidylyltransferase